MFPHPPRSLSLPHTYTLRAISMGIPLPLMLMTPFPFPWRQCSVAVAIWILMAVTLHRPAACFQPHSFVYVENHIKVNYYWEVAKSNMLCEERRKKNIKFAISKSFTLECYSKAFNNECFLWCNRDTRDIKSSAPLRWKIWKWTDSLQIKETIISLNSTILCYLCTW